MKRISGDHRRIEVRRLGPEIGETLYSSTTFNDVNFEACFTCLEEEILKVENLFENSAFNDNFKICFTNHL